MCRTPNCQFIHPEVPANSSLKWQAATYASGPKSVLDNLNKKIEEVNCLVKKREEAQMNEELDKLKEVTASLESTSAIET